MEAGPYKQGIIGAGMTIDGIGGKNFGPVTGVKKSQKPQKTKAMGTPAATDKVQFSAVLQEVHRAKGSDGTASAERTAKVESLKQQVADGSYQPDLQKVAASLLRFLVEER